MHDMGNLRVLDAGMVRPSDLDLPPRSLPLTFVDVKWLRPPSVQRLFLYRLQHHHDTTHLISDLKAFLSKALSLFYPLAGHIRLATNSNRYELFYQPSDLAHNKPVQVAKLAPLVPPLPKGRVVLAVQATMLLGGQGLCLGVTVHHSDCDGASSMHFMHTWAAAPVIDRTIIADPRGIYDIYSKRMPSGGREIEFVSSSVSSVPDNQLLATFVAVNLCSLGL